MKLVLIGASGFIGKAVLRSAIRQGADVLVVRRPESLDKRNLIEKDHKTVLCPHKEDALINNETLKNFGPAVWIDFSWDGVLGIDNQDDRQIENIQRAVGIFKAALTLHATHFIGTGSQAEYGPCSGRISENQKLAPVTLYGAAKAATFLTLSALSANLNANFTWVRIFSTYGPGDSSSWFIPSLFRSIYRGSQIEITKCEQLWDYLYVDDAAEAFLEIAKLERAAGVINLGSGRTVKLSDVAAKVSELADPKHKLVFGGRDYAKNQVMHLEADITKIQKLTGWNVRVPFEQGLTETLTRLLESAEA